MRPRELTLRGFLEHMFEAFTSVDSKLIRSFRYLVIRPGELTVAYLEGRRAPYLKPVPLFLIANVLFFAIESLLGGAVFSTPLDWHLHRQPWSGFAPQLVADRLDTLHTTLELYAPVFDKAVAIKARSLIIFMALFFSLVPMLVFIRSKRPLVSHAVFALHLYTFMLLLFCVAIAIPALSAWMGGPGFDSDGLDHFLSISLLLICAAHLFIAVRAVYGVRGFARVLSVVVLAIALGVVALGYRFFLFVVTLYTT
jgi:hypothetical protein